MMRLAPVKYTIEEGGQWYAWVYRPPQRPFAIMFEDGSIFDPIVGWREPHYCSHCGQRKIESNVS